jgi:hypothetical protein
VLKRFETLLEELTKAYPQNPLLPELRENVMEVIKF